MIRLTDAIDPSRRIHVVGHTDVARMFRTDVETVERWVAEGTLKESILDGLACFSERNLNDFVGENALDPRKIIENLQRGEKERLPEVPYEEDPLAAFKLDAGRYRVYVEQTVDGEITKITIGDGEEVLEFMGPPEMREEIMKVILEGELK
jgi:hypothetical protein